jgi:heme exporter protein A
LSRGLQQRVSLARALVHDPQIVFLDEPFTGLDPQAARTLSRLLERLRREGRSVLLVTHNLARGLELTDRWLLLSAGSVLDQGRSAETDRRDFEAEYFRRFEGRATA